MSGSIEQTKQSSGDLDMMKGLRFLRGVTEKLILLL